MSGPAPSVILPEAEPLPEGLLAWGEAWQRGLRLVDRPFADGRLTAGIWHSGAFETSDFLFEGCEWFRVITGRIELEIGGARGVTGPGETGCAPKDTRLVWRQPEPVLKLFLRWDGAGAAPDPAALWAAAGAGLPGFAA